MCIERDAGLEPKRARRGASRWVRSGGEATVDWQPLGGVGRRKKALPGAVCAGQHLGGEEGGERAASRGCGWG